MFTKLPVTKNSLAMRKAVYGVGINDADYMVRPVINGKKYICPMYSTWADMIERCYSDRLHERQPTYKGCTIARDWLTFSVFSKWMADQDWQGKQLDKDILFYGNKVYGPHTCIFVTGALNSLLRDNARNDGGLLLGVCRDISRGGYISQCCINKQRIFLGRYSTQKQAHAVYCAFKSAHVAAMADENKDNARLHDALITHSIRIAAMPGDSV